MKIGIVGNGFVGSSVAFGFSPQCGCDGADVKIYDKDESKSTHSLEEVLLSEFIFLSVPTPSKPDGSVSLKIVYDIFDEINETNTRPDNIILLRSTVTPGTTRKLQIGFHNLNIVFNPEFLTEAKSFDDFKNQSRIIIGGNPAIDCHGAKKVKQMFRKPFPDIPIIVTKWETAEMVKYFTNCFLATKVTFANQMYEICEAARVDYDKVCEYALYDERIGKTHLAVPGPDGDRGFGGHCFPKDLAAMIYYAWETVDADRGFLEAIECMNEHYRTNKDWEKMKGRAVSED